MRIALGTMLFAGLLAVSQTAAPASAQGLAPGNSPLQTWRQDSQGLSPNAALAFHRIRNNTPSLQRPSPRAFHRLPTPAPTRTFVETNSLGNYWQYYYAIPAIGYGAPAAVTAPRETAFDAKPFSQVRPAPNAVNRYWPLLMERREDPETGLIIWQLP